MPQSELITRPAATQSELISRPEGLSGSGSSGVDSDAVVFDVTTATQADPSDILGSVSQLFDDVSVSLDANTISNTPSTAVSWRHTIENIFGDTSDVDLVDIIRTVFRLGSVVPPTDLWVGMAVADSTLANGFAVRLAAVSGDWQVQHASAAGAGWSAWTVATSDGETQALIGGIIQGNGTSQARIGAAALDSVGTPQGGATPTAPSSANIGNNLTHVYLCAGFIAGALGAVPTTFTVRAGTIAAKATDFEAIARFFQ